MKHKLLIITFFILTNFAFGQMEQLIGLRNLYSKTDSLIKLKKPFVITEEFKSTLIDLDKGHPAKFFEKFNEYLNKDKFDECSFLYHLGVLRYRYYNATNKDYQASGDGALFSSLKYMTGEIISIYLKNDIDKYIEILNSVDNYCENNDYTFHSKFINIEKYNELKFVDLIKNLSENKNTFTEEWSKERKEMKDNLDKAVEEFNKMSEEDRKKLNKN